MGMGNTVLSSAFELLLFDELQLTHSIKIKCKERSNLTRADIAIDSNDKNCTGALFFLSNSIFQIFITPYLSDLKEKKKSWNPSHLKYFLFYLCATCSQFGL